MPERRPSGDRTRSTTDVSGNPNDTLKARGFIAQVSDEEAVRKMLG